MHPELVRLSFSHYCRKVEWALQAAGIRYKARNVTFRMLADFGDMHPDGTVPLLAVDGERIAGSSAILRWIDNVADLGLYPAGQPDVAAWEAWADETIGPVARRTAYRAIHAKPTSYTRNPVLWAVFAAGRGAVLNILKFYKARRTEASDPVDLDAAIDRVLENLEGPFLFGEAPTAADYAVAALLQPVVRIHPDIHPRMPELREYIGRVAKPLRRGRRLGSGDRRRIASYPLRAE